MLRVFKVSGRSNRSKNYILAKTKEGWFEAEQVLKKKEERKQTIGNNPFFVSPSGDIFLFAYIDREEEAIVRLVVDGVRQEGDVLIFTTKERKE